jgi:hypothetical protein
MRNDVVQFSATCPCGAEADWTATRPLYDPAAEFWGIPVPGSPPPGPEYTIEHDGPCSERKTA